VLNHATNHTQTRYLQAEKNQPRKQHIYFFPNATSNAKKTKELFLPLRSKILSRKN
jgi:hypothetical protein